MGKFNESVGSNLTSACPTVPPSSTGIGSATKDASTKSRVVQQPCSALCCLLSSGHVERRASIRTGFLALVIFATSCKPPSSSNSVSGTIETDEVRVASRYGGRVEKT